MTLPFVEYDSHGTAVGLLMVPIFAFETATDASCIAAEVVHQLTANEGLAAAASPSPSGIGWSLTAPMRRGTKVITVASPVPAPWQAGPFPAYRSGGVFAAWTSRSLLLGGQKPGETGFGAGRFVETVSP